MGILSEKSTGPFARSESAATQHPHCVVVIVVVVGVAAVAAVAAVAVDLVLYYTCHAKTNPPPP